MRKIVLLALIVLAITVSVATADTAFRPSRVRMLIHGGYDLVDDGVRLETRFLPAGNLLGELAPIAYLGVQTEVTDWLRLEGYTGWMFREAEVGEPFVSFSLRPQLGPFYVWTETRWSPWSNDGYWFTQVDYQFTEWLHTGVEGEGWGNYREKNSWSQGGGPNLLLRFGQVGADLAIHWRESLDTVKPGQAPEKVIKPEFFLRLHYWF